MNTIAGDQNSPPFQRLLKARQHVYWDATRLQIAQLIATVLLPVAGAALATFVATSRPWVALYGLVVTVFDLFWIDRSLRDRLKVAAKISEKFELRALQVAVECLHCRKARQRGDRRCGRQKMVRQ